METYSQQDVAGWECREKLDGVFARWGDGVLFTRDWLPIPAPAWLTAGKMPAEGEIWHKDGLQRVQGCLSWGAESERWEGVQFIPHAEIPCAIVSGIDEAAGIFEGIVARGGEGIVLRNPNTGEMLKVKPTQDEEATVVGYTLGSGRNPGIGSLVLQRGHLKFKLSVGLSGRDRLNPPTIGSRITYWFDGKTKAGLPRNARFMRVRVLA